MMKERMTLEMMQGFDDWYVKKTKKRERVRTSLFSLLFFLAFVMIGNQFFTCSYYERHYANYLCLGRGSSQDINITLVSMI